MPQGRRMPGEWGVERLVCLTAQLGESRLWLGQSEIIEQKKSFTNAATLLYWWSFSVCRNVSWTHAVKEALVSSSHLLNVHMETVVKIARQGLLPIRGKSEKENGYLEMHPLRSLYTI